MLVERSSLVSLPLLRKTVGEGVNALGIDGAVNASVDLLAEPDEDQVQVQEVVSTQELDRVAMLEHARIWPTRERPGYGLVEDSRGYGIVTTREMREKLGGALWEPAGGDKL